MLCQPPLYFPALVRRGWGGIKLRIGIGLLIIYNSVVWKKSMVCPLKRVGIIYSLTEGLVLGESLSRSEESSVFSSGEDSSIGSFLPSSITSSYSGTTIPRLIIMLYIRSARWTTYLLSPKGLYLLGFGRAANNLADSTGSSSEADFP